jgi:hypothetical protein
MKANANIPASSAVPNFERARIATSESLSLRATADRFEHRGERTSALLFRNEAFRLETSGDPEIKIVRLKKDRS